LKYFRQKIGEKMPSLFKLLQVVEKMDHNICFCFWCFLLKLLLFYKLLFFEKNAIFSPKIGKIAKVSAVRPNLITQ
jgi:hypothetical protein